MKVQPGQGGWKNTTVEGRGRRFFSSFNAGLDRGGRRRFFQGIAGRFSHFPQLCKTISPRRCGKLVSRVGQTFLKNMFCFVFCPVSFRMIYGGGRTFSCKSYNCACCEAVCDSAVTFRDAKSTIFAPRQELKGRVAQIRARVQRTNVGDTPLLFNTQHRV